MKDTDQLNPDDYCTQCGRSARLNRQRPPNEMYARLAPKVIAFVKATPHCNQRELRTALGIPEPEYFIFHRVMIRLVREGRVIKHGVRMTNSYTVPEAK